MKLPSFLWLPVVWIALAALNPSLVYAVVVADTSINTAAGKVVTVDINNSTFTFETKPRLTDVLAPVALKQNWYWPAAKLYRLDPNNLNGNEPEQLRAKVLQQLQVLVNTAEPALQRELAALQAQIKRWQLAERILIPIDYDLARAKAPLNPRFEAGSYQLQLVERPEDVSFWGAVTKTLAIPHNGAAAIADYLPAIERSAFADESVVFLMQPDGHIVKVGVAAWNQQHFEAMPGAQVYIPFAAGWFGNKIDNLNQDLLALALHRVSE